MRWRIGLGVLLLLMAAVNSTERVTDDPAAGFGALTGLALLVAAGIALIASGLPRTIGDDDFRRRRRRIWYRMLAAGLLAMVTFTTMLASFALVGAAVAVTWLYWFGWTWISWQLADTRARHDVEHAD